MYKKIKKFLIISSELNINYTKDVLSIIKDKDIYKILIPLIFGAIFIISLFTNGHISDYTYTYLLEPKDLLLMLGYSICLYIFCILLLYTTRIVRNFKAIPLLFKSTKIFYDTKNDYIKFLVDKEEYYIQSVYYRGKIDPSKLRSIKLKLLISNVLYIKEKKIK